MEKQHALVVYESMFGNSREIAEAVALGLSHHLSVRIVDVSGTPDTTGFDLVVAGGPTHAFSLSRPATRAEAVQKGATVGTVDRGLREWLGELSHSTSGQAFATFDTRVDAVRHLPGSAARKASRMAHELGFTMLGRETFRVTGAAGPLLEGEAERARQWGRTLGARLASLQDSRPSR